jgi:Flp pilus assembly protein TadG
MKYVFSNLRNRRGFTLVLTAFMITVALGAGALAIDIGRMQYYRTVLQASADAAALAGAKSLMNGSFLTASADMATYAQKYSIQGTAVTNYSTIPGDWSPGGGFVAGSWNKDARAVRDSVSYNLTNDQSFTFGRIFGLTNRTLHAGADAIVASVGATTCVRPLGVPFQALLNQLYAQGFHSTRQLADSYTLADSDIVALKTSTTLTQLKITDASDSPDPINGSYYLLQMGPYAPAGSTPGTAGTPYSPGPDWGGASVNGGFPSRFAGDCSNSTWTVKVGDWMQGKQGNVNGPMQSAYDQMCGTHIVGNNNTYYCTVSVPLRTIKVAMWSTQNSTVCSPRCFQVKYLGAFVLDHYTNSGGGGSNGGDGLFGYFTAVASNGSVTGTGSGSSGGTLLTLALVH